MNDPIVDEVRKVRDAYAARFNYDLDAIFRDIKEREAKSGLTFVAPPPGPSIKDPSLSATGPEFSDTETPSPEEWTEI